MLIFIATASWIILFSISQLNNEESLRWMIRSHEQMDLAIAERELANKMLKVVLKDLQSKRQETVA